jgi:formate/nitrite transporter FocA (FNT family)
MGFSTPVLFCICAGNFVGSLAFVALVVASGVLAQGAMYPIKTAMAKASLPWGQVSPASRCREGLLLAVE